MPQPETATAPSQSPQTQTSVDTTMTQPNKPNETRPAPQQAASAPALRPMGITPAAPLGAQPNKPADLPMSRFGGIPGVMPRRVGTPGDGMSMGSPAYGMQSNAGADQSGLRKLTVGREITLSGDITTCDILVVEGNIDATLRDGKILEISQDGHFRGAAEVDEADIGGRFEGTLTVRGRLRLRATGQIEGSISYGELEVEAGGRMIGELKVLGSVGDKKKSDANKMLNDEKDRVIAGADA